MFDAKHYVPILKWKRAEQGALQALDIKTKEYVTPLIQLVMPIAKADEKLSDIVFRFQASISDIAVKIAEAWGKTPIFVDVSLLYTTELKASTIFGVIDIGRKLGGHFIPVLHLGDDPQIRKLVFKAAHKTGNGLCLRLVCADFTDMDSLGRKIYELMREGELKAGQIDLLVDIKETGEDGAKCMSYLSLSQQIKNLPQWRTFIFASGAYPQNLSKCERDEPTELPRVDWLCWKDFVDKKNQRRIPSFADYTIQHPVYLETTQFFHPTTSIKYALENAWLILKGERKKFGNYLAGAAILTGDASRFFGEKFSAGDQYISEKARYYPVYIRAIDKGENPKGTGSTETWLKAGINHHITLTAHQIANLP